MANRRNTKKTSSVLKSGSVSSTLKGKKAKKGEITIKNYSFESLIILKETNIYNEAIITVAAVIVTVVLLVQLRCLNPEANSAKLDQTQAFRFYKRRVIVSEYGKTTACLLASTLENVVVFLPDDQEQFVEMVLALGDAFQGNERLIEKCSNNNLTDYVHGQMTSIIGTMASCPSSNISAFGLNTDCVNWTVEDVLSSVPNTDIQALSVDVVKNKIREMCGVVPNSEGVVTPVKFEDKPLSGGQSVDGGCVLEKDIFGSNMPVRTRTTSGTSASGKAKVGKTDVEKYRSVLSAFELRKLEAAIKVEKTDLVKKMVALAESRLKADPKEEAPLESSSADE